MRSLRSFVALLLVVASSAVLGQDRPPGPPGLPPGFPPGVKPAEEKPEFPAERTVELNTSDGLALAGTFWPGAKEGGPGAVLLHMYRSDRSAWAPLVQPLRRRGFAVLAIDLRGHGDSAEQGKDDLSKRVEKRDPKLFAAMHHDARAALDWMVAEGKCDAGRLALVGASVGCSVAIDTTRRHPKAVKAVVCLTPGAKYLGLDSLEHLKGVPEATPLVLFSHTTELEAGATALVAARPSTGLVTYDSKPREGTEDKPGWAHGTRMFGQLPLAAWAVASSVAARVGGGTDDVILDGRLTSDGALADDWSRAEVVSPAGSPGEVRAYLVGRRVVFGGRMPKDHAGLRFEVQCGGGMDAAEVRNGRPIASGPPQIVSIDVARKLRLWSRGGMGSIPNLPGMDTSKMFGKTYPFLHSVTHEDGTTTFEGEWYVPPIGPPAGGIRLLVRVSKEAPPREGAGVRIDLENAVELSSR